MMYFIFPKKINFPPTTDSPAKSWWPFDIANRNFEETNITDDVVKYDDMPDIV